MKFRAPLRVIDGQAEKDRFLHRERERLYRPALIGWSAFCLLNAALFVLRQKGILTISEAGRSPALFTGILALLSFGFIPLVVASLVMLAVKPDPVILLGTTPDRWSLLFSPLLGVLAGFLVWCVREFAASWSVSVDRYVNIPSVIARSAPYTGRSLTELLLILFACVIVPATALEVLLHGVIQQGLISASGPRAAALMVSVTAALSFFDVPGFVILFFGFYLSARVCAFCDSLIASSLATFGYFLALLYSGRMFVAAGSALFGSIAMDDAKHRVFLLSCIMILSLLLIAPAAYLQGIRNRAGNGPVSPPDADASPAHASTPNFLTPVAGIALFLMLVLCLISAGQ